MEPVSHSWVWLWADICGRIVDGWYANQRRIHVDPALYLVTVPGEGPIDGAVDAIARFVLGNCYQFVSMQVEILFTCCFWAVFFQVCFCLPCVSFGAVV